MEAHREKLTNIGMTWDYQTVSTWDQNYEIAKSYYDVHGNICINGAAEINGIKIGRWLIAQRSLFHRGKLSKERTLKLEAIGVDWCSTFSQKWNAQYEEAKNFFQENGHLHIPIRLKSLYTWCTAQRKKYNDGKLDAGQIILLNEIGMQWK